MLMKKTNLLWNNPFINWPTFFEDQNWIMPNIFQDGLTLSEDEKKVYVELSLPGVESENIEIDFQNGILTVSGEGKEELKKRTYYRKATRSFHYRTTLPGSVSKDSVPEAEYKNGLVTVIFSKMHQEPKKKIKVKV